MNKIRYYYNCIDDINIINKYENDKYYNSWFQIVKKILRHKEFQKRRLFLHHENESLWTHCIKVSFNSYKYAIKHNLNSYDCAIAGLLHDFYTKAWQYSNELEKLNSKYRAKFINNNKVKFSECHGIYHPIEALENSKKYFKKYLNSNIENAIITHMFPLSIFNEIKLPKSKESFVVSTVDKIVSLNVLIHVKEIGKYIGIKRVNIK